MLSKDICHLLGSEESRSIKELRLSNQWVQGTVSVIETRPRAQAQMNFVCFSFNFERTQSKTNFGLWELRLKQDQDETRETKNIKICTSEATPADKSKQICSTQLECYLLLLFVRLLFNYVIQLTFKNKLLEVFVQ